jgi:hypothetical protein
VDDRTIEMGELIIEHERVDNYCRLHVSLHRHSIANVRYEAPRLEPPLEEDPTAFIEEDDFDFGLYLANMSKDQKRQIRLFAEQ